MSHVDDEIRDALRQSLDATPVPPGRLDAVRERHRRGVRRRRMIAAGSVAVAAIVATAGVTAYVARPDDRAGQTVVQRPGLPNPLRVVRSFPATDLGLTRPQAVAVGPNGNLFVTDSVAQTVTQLTTDGTVVSRWGQPGAGPGEFRLADGGIAVGPDGRVYVADSGNARVQVFDPDGTFVRQLGGFGNGPGRFEWPWAIAVGPDGSVYVSDDRAATLTKLSPDGHQDWRLGGRGTPAALVGHDHFGGFDSEGRLVLANDDSGFVLYVDPAGHIVDQFGTGASGDHENTLSHPAALDFPDGACDTTVGPDDTVYVAGCVAPRGHGLLIQVYDPGHHMVGRWPDSPIITAPRFGPDGTAAAISADLSVVELAARRN